MKQDETPDPANIGLFGAQAVMFEAQPVPDCIQEFAFSIFRHYLDPNLFVAVFVYLNSMRNKKMAKPIQVMRHLLPGYAAEVPHNL